MRRFTFLWTLAIAGAAHASGAQQPAPKKINGGLPFVSPDGSRIAFVRQTGPMGGDIYVVGADGTGERRLGAAGNGAAKWLPDGRRLVFGVGKFNEDSSDVRTIDLSSGASTNLARIAGRDATVMADEKTVLASAGKWPNLGIVQISLGDGAKKDLTSAPGAYFNIAVSPDGKRLAFAHAEADMKNMQIWTMNADGSGLRPLSHLTAADGSPQWPSWSPDGKTLAVQAGVYVRDNPAANTAHIWLIDAATGAATKLAAHAPGYLDETPAFFPDGKHIAFQSDRTGRMEVWVMNVDGTGARQITR